MFTRLIAQNFPDVEKEFNIEISEAYRNLNNHDHTQAQKPNQPNKKHSMLRSN